MSAMPLASAILSARGKQRRAVSRQIGNTADKAAQLSSASNFWQRQAGSVFGQQAELEVRFSEEQLWPNIQVALC